MIISTKCRHCENNFNADTRELNRGNAIYCSLSCVAKHFNKKRKKETFQHNCKCSNCNLTFYRNKSKSITKTGTLFCSRKCKDNFVRTQLTFSKDYRRTIKLTTGIKSCQRCGYNEYIDILQVHHKDKNRNNNKLANLEVLCPNCHELEHKLGINILLNKMSL